MIPFHELIIGHAVHLCVVLTTQGQDSHPYLIHGLSVISHTDRIKMMKVSFATADCTFLVVQTGVYVFLKVIAQCL